ncbi:MAG: FHA domain-containing protein [Bacteroidia bacterium]|nr:FHA domain-containing protein [Bacteroidia bacterium]MDW8416846.1 FHA domain-containing protein [Bacteroidia bacterium]
MNRFHLYWLMPVLFAQRADLTILVETSQLTCGKPLEISRKALKALCDKSSGSIALGTFSRLYGGQAVVWRTTPVQPLNDAEGCSQLFNQVRPICDSVYQVTLIQAIEEAISKGYSSDILVLASGKETGRGISAGELRNYAKKKGVKLYLASIGWLMNDERTQSFFKQLAGTLEGETGTLIIIDPSSPDAAERLRGFIFKVWENSGKAPRSESAAMDGGNPSGTATGGSNPKIDLEKQDGSGMPKWIWIALAAGGGVLLLVLLILLLRPKSAPPPPVNVSPAPPSTSTLPPPQPVAPPAPTLRRLIVYYPHTRQEVNLSPSTAPISIGRAPDNTIVIADNTVSSRHARLFLQGTQWYIQDLGSTNGTFVNEQRVSQHPVRIGDKIRLGAIVVQIAG